MIFLLNLQIIDIAELSSFDISDIIRMKSSVRI